MARQIHRITRDGVTLYRTWERNCDGYMCPPMPRAEFVAGFNMDPRPDWAWHPDCVPPDDGDDYWSPERKLCKGYEIGPDGWLIEDP